jgi:DNA-binding MarR family transcriptional regulator
MHQAPAAPDGFHAVEALRRLVRLLHDSARMAQGRTGISGAQLFVLRTLAQHPGLSINDLAERTMTHQSSVSVVVSRLLVRGLVARAPSPDDRRRQLVTLTARGRALYHRSPPVAQERIVEAVRKLSPARRHGLSDGLQALAKALCASPRGASMFFEDDNVPAGTVPVGAPRPRRASAPGRRISKANA